MPVLVILNSAITVMQTPIIVVEPEKTNLAISLLSFGVFICSKNIGDNYLKNVKND